MAECVFCQLYSRQAAARIIYRDESSFAFFPLEPEVRGHTILAPVHHVATWPELAEDLVRSLFLATQEVSRRLCLQLSAEAVNVLFASGPEAQQSIPHFHVHILPRWRGDGVDAWPSLPGYNGDIDADFRALTTSSVPPGTAG